MSTNIKKYFKEFGELLDFVLNNKGLSASELAVLIGKDNSQISNWINNKNKPFRKTYQKISKALNLEIVENENDWELTIKEKIKNHESEPEKKHTHLQNEQLAESITFVENSLPYLKAEITDPAKRNILAGQLIELVLSDIEVHHKYMKNLEERLFRLQRLIKGE